MNQPETIEEELAIIAEALEAGIDPFPPKKEESRWIRTSLGWFMIIIMISWVSQLLYRHPECHMMDHYTKGLASSRHRSNISTNPSYEESSGSESSVHFLKALRAGPHFLIRKANQRSICQSKSVSSGWLIWIVIQKPRYMMSFLSRFMNRS